MTDMEIKTIILSVYEAIDIDVDKTEVEQSILSTGVSDIFDYEECVRELIDAELLFLSDVDGKVFCGITQKGKETISQLDGVMPVAQRERAVKKAITYFESLHTGKFYSVDLEKSGDGYYIIEKYYTKEKVLMETKMYFDDHEKAMECYKTCELKPEMIYNGLMTIMTGKINHLI